jgi:hypothetical protein
MHNGKQKECAIQVTVSYNKQTVKVLKQKTAKF